MSTVVSFTSSVPGKPDSLLWDFGDGSTSAQANPSHVYTASGVFVVRLTATKSNISTSVAKTVAIAGEGSSSGYVPLTNNEGNVLTNNELDQLVVNLGDS